MSAITVDEFIAAHGAEIERLENGKIKCVLTGTDLPAKIDVLQVRQRESRGSSAVADNEGPCDRGIAMPCWTV